MFLAAPPVAAFILMAATAVSLNALSRSLISCGESSLWGPARQCVLSHNQGALSLNDCYIEISGRSQSGMLPEVWLV